MAKGMHEEIMAEQQQLILMGTENAVHHTKYTYIENQSGYIVK
jgi:hypothetical protein